MVVVSREVIVVIARPCAGESEFTSLEQWEREYRLFGQLHRIPFFKKYRKWKGFSVWKKSVRRDKSGGVRIPETPERLSRFSSRSHSLVIL